MTGVPIREKTYEGKTKKKTPSEDRGGNRRDSSTSQGVPRIVVNHPKLGERHETHSPS